MWMLSPLITVPCLLTCLFTRGRTGGFSPGTPVSSHTKTTEMPPSAPKKEIFAWSQCAGTPLALTASEAPAMFESPGYNSGGYSNDQYCEWLVDSGVAGQRILLFADNISLNCANNDTVTIYDGNSNSDTPLLSAHCGTMATTEYTSTGRYVLVTFTSDSSLTDVGFQMTYLSAADSSGSGCSGSGQQTLTASSTAQYLTSSGFPDKYSSSSSCRWKIMATTTVSTVNVEIIFSDIEDDTSCSYDKLTLYDGGYLCENKVVQDVCSPRTGAGVVIANFTSTEDSVLIIFASDSSFEKRGFVIKYTENFVNYTTTSTTSSTVTSSTLSSSSSVNGVTYSSVTTETKTELSVPMMVACFLSGVATVVAVIALVFLVKFIKVRKRLKKGVIAVQAIAPLPARPTVFTPRQGTNVLSFV